MQAVGAAMFEPPPPPDLVATFGGTADDYQTEIDLLPSIVPSFNVYRAMSTQWNIGFGGRTGLNYAALPVVFDLLKVPEEDRSSIFEDVQIMELATLGAAHG